MARQPRLAIAGLPHHLLQRGNNSQPVFVDAEDRTRFLRILGEEAQRCEVAVHAYVLLDDHVHLLATPSTGLALSRWMQGLGRRYVRSFNQRHARSGTLWNGRYRATVIQPDRHLLTAMAFIDLHPVRSGLTVEPGEYAWSSHLHYAGLRTDPMLTTPEPVWRLANTPFAREAAYRERVREGIDESSVQALTRSVLQAWVLGDPSFVARLQQQSERRLSPLPRGRPPAKPRGR